MRLKFTASDLKQGKVVKAGRYKGRIEEVQTKAAKTDGSTNYVFVITGLDGDSKDVRFQDLYSEKYLGRMTQLLEALGVTLPEDEDLDLDLEKFSGREVGIEVGNEMYQNRLRNRINGYFPIA